MNRYLAMDDGKAMADVDDGNEQQEELMDIPEAWPSDDQMPSGRMESLHDSVLQSSGHGDSEDQPDSAIVVPKGGQPQTCPLCKKLLLGGGKVVRKHLRRVHGANVVSARPGPPRPRLGEAGAAVHRRKRASTTASHGAGSCRSVRESLSALLKEQVDDVHDGFGDIAPEEWIGHTVRGVIHSKFSHGYFVTITVGSEQLSGILYHAPETGVQGARAIRMLKDEAQSGWNYMQSEQKQPRFVHGSSVASVAEGGNFVQDGNGLHGGGEEDEGRDVIGGGEEEGSFASDEDEDISDEYDDVEEESFQHMDHFPPMGGGERSVPPTTLAAFPPKPKRTSFNFYYSEWRALLKAQRPDLPESDISRMIGERWGRLSKEEKEPYLELWRQDRDRWQAEQLAYNAYRLHVAFS